MSFSAHKKYFLVGAIVFVILIFAHKSTKCTKATYDALYSFSKNEEIFLLFYPCKKRTCGVPMDGKDKTSFIESLNEIQHGNQYYRLSGKCELTITKNGNNYNYLLGVTDKNEIVIHPIDRYSDTTLTYYVSVSNYNTKQIVISDQRFLSRFFDKKNIEECFAV